MKTLTIRLLKTDDGQDLIEYGLLAGIITLAAVLAVVSIGGKVSTYFTSLDVLMP
jgi:pilus assembly protein Flp/PilA